MPLFKTVKEETKCPKCRKEISHLIAVETTPKSFDYYVNDKGVSSWDEIETSTGYIFKCPDCLSELAYTETKAKNILMNKEV